MKKFLSIALAAIGAVVGTVASSGCVLALLDEPEMPASLID
jgi:cyclic lactone autoinducer peptide